MPQGKFNGVHAVLTLALGAAALQGCASILGIDEPKGCEGSACGGVGGAGGTRFSAGDGNLGGLAGGQDGGASGSVAVESSVAGQAGAGLAGEAGSEAECAAAAGAAHGGESGAPSKLECPSNPTHCDRYQPVACVDGAWAPQGNACPVCRDGVCAPRQPSCPATVEAACGDHNDCCETIWLDGGGPYEMGAGNLDGDQTYQRTVGGFYLDRFEVTVARFRLFFEQYELSGMPANGAGQHPRIAGSGWNSAWLDLPDPYSTDTQDPNPRAVPKSQAELSSQLTRNPGTWPSGDSFLPITGVNWFVAFAFCIWDGGRLPTEAEWNFAASAGHGWLYPWSKSDTDSSVSDDYANYASSGPVRAGSYRKGRGFFFKTPTADRDQGHDDLAGNAAEWVADGLDEDMSQDNLVDYLSPWRATDQKRIVRGGSFFSASYADIRSGARVSEDAYASFQLYGVRCARDSTNLGEKR